MVFARSAHYVYEHRGRCESDPFRNFFGNCNGLCSHITDARCVVCDFQRVHTGSVFLIMPCVRFGITQCGWCGGSVNQCRFSSRTISCTTLCSSYRRFPTGQCLLTKQSTRVTHETLSVRGPQTRTRMYISKPRYRNTPGIEYKHLLYGDEKSFG